jgi:hypothetical protein
VIKRLSSEIQAERKEISKDLIKPENLKIRQQFVFYTALGISGLSFILLKKGFIRYAFRNGAFTYLFCSLIVCPENINPF